MTKDLPTLDGIKNAKKNISPFILETPLVYSDILSKSLGIEIWLKNETVSPIASFKLRGALNHLLEAKKVRTIKAAVATSTGNHGQGVAYACKLLNIPAHIFLPENPNPVKKMMIETFSGIIHEYGHDYDEAKLKAEDFCKQNGYEHVDEDNSLPLIQGAGTIGLEVAEKLKDIDYIIAGMGSGALVSGSGAALKFIQPNAKVIAVSPSGSPAMVESFFAKRPVEKPINTIADGIVCRIPGKLLLDLVLHFVDDAYLVSDEEILRAVHTLIVYSHIMVEPSGAASLAALYLNKEKLKGKKVVLIISGGNISREQIQAAFEKEPFISTKSLLAV